MQAEPDSRPTLIMGWGGEIQNPSGNEIEKAIRSMPGGENSFVILRKETDIFIQVAGPEESGYLLEYWEDKQGHYCTATDLSLNTVIKAFQSYAWGDETWRSSVPWEAMEEKSGVENQAKKRKSRFTRKGIIRLALFAVLFLIGCFIFTPVGIMIAGMFALLPGLFIYIDLDFQKKNYSLPAPFFTALVNIVLLAPVIGILWSQPWQDWLSFSLIIPLGAFSVLLFWWGRRLVYLFRLKREGIEVKPSRVWSEQYKTMGDAGPMTRTRIVYRYAGDHIGQRNPFWGKPDKEQLFVCYLPDKPSVHRLIRRKQSL
jgi:hypothetical protein